MPGMDVHFSSVDRNAETPQDFFDQVDKVFGFTLDVCATPLTAKCEDYIMPEEDTFMVPWGKRICWMNPPYGDPEMPCKSNCKKKRCLQHDASCKPDCKAHRGYHIAEYIPGIIDFMKRAVSQWQNGATVVCLVPARVDTEWWQTYVAQADEVIFVRGRLKFGENEFAAPFPSALVVFLSRSSKRKPHDHYVWYWNPQTENFEELYYMKGQKIVA